MRTFISILSLMLILGNGTSCGTLLNTNTEGVEEEARRVSVTFTPEEFFFLFLDQILEEGDGALMPLPGAREGDGEEDDDDDGPVSFPSSQWSATGEISPTQRGIHKGYVIERASDHTVPLQPGDLLSLDGKEVTIVECSLLEDTKYTVYIAGSPLESLPPTIKIFARPTNWLDFHPIDWTEGGWIHGVSPSHHIAFVHNTEVMREEYAPGKKIHLWNGEFHEILEASVAERFLHVTFAEEVLGRSSQWCLQNPSNASSEGFLIVQVKGYEAHIQEGDILRFSNGQRKILTRVEKRDDGWLINFDQTFPVHPDFLKEPFEISSPEKI